MTNLLALPWIPRYNQVPPSEEDAVSSPWLLYSLAATIAFTVAVYSLEGTLDARQKLAYQATEFPAELAKTVSEIDQSKASTTTSSSDKKDEKAEPLLPQLQEKFVKAQAYGLDKINFGMIAGTYDTVESVVFLLLGFLPWAWDLAVKLGGLWMNWNETDNEIYISLIFLAIVTVVGTITSLPFELYSTFQIERKHGFNKQTIGLFFTDKVKTLLLTFVIGGPFVSLLLYIIRAGGEYFYLYVWAFMFVFSVFMMTIVPVFIMPLFNEYKPLEDGTLKTRIYELAGQLKYPLTKLFVMDGSKRSSHSNAFVSLKYNFLCEMMLLLDTFLAEFDLRDAQ